MAGLFFMFMAMLSVVQHITDVDTSSGVVSARRNPDSDNHSPM